MNFFDASPTEMKYAPPGKSAVFQQEAKNFNIFKNSCRPVRGCSHLTTTIGIRILLSKGVIKQEVPNA